MYCAHEYTQSNARFALSVEPNNEALKARAAEVASLREKGQPTVPSTLAVEKATNPFLRPDSAELQARSPGIPRLALCTPRSAPAVRSGPIGVSTVRCPESEWCRQCLLSQATIGLKGASLVEVFAETRRRKDKF